jgi:uncharacterized protein
MLDDCFVLDCVVHPFNFDRSNFLSPSAEMFANHLYAFHQVLTPAGQRQLEPQEFLRDWPVAEVAEMALAESQTDMVSSMPLPLTDFFGDGGSGWERCSELHRRYPDRSVLWATVNPLEGRKALELLEVQVKEHGARALKLYNVRYDYGSPFPWRMDDPVVAFPVFRKCRELGITTIGVHKGVPLGPQPIEHTQAWDMDGAAANFPDLNFIIFHVGLPFIDEVCWQLVRYPNLYASIAATVNFIVRAPRAFAEMLGKLLFWCGEDKIIYGSEAPIFHPRWALEALWEFDIPADLQQGYGYPPLSREAKRKILGENLARLLGIDVAAQQQRIASDRFSEAQRNLAGAAR